MTSKYQFCIRFKGIDANSAASKAVLDCNSIFAHHGYEDYTFTVDNNFKKTRYYFRLSIELFGFFIQLKRNSLVGIQYPLLSINNVFKHFIKLAKLKGIRFFCVIHDLESVRTGANDPHSISKEIGNLNCYDVVIAHNQSMASWLARNGARNNLVSLDLFDYLANGVDRPLTTHSDKTIVYAGNLNKSTFIYDLHIIPGWRFNLYGPNYKPRNMAERAQLCWKGEFSPEQIVHELQGAYGLIWDGTDIEKCDEVLGNYLKYNNPHKCSLYIAAGLPVIAPRDSAIGKLITQLNIGLLVDSLYELEYHEVSEQSYAQMKRNVLKLRQKVIKGDFFSNALKKIEEQYV